MKIGDLIHYVTFGSVNGDYPVECCASIVTGLYKDNSEVDITVFNKRGGSFPNRKIRYDVKVDEGTWHLIDDPDHIW